MNSAWIVARRVARDDDALVAERAGEVVAGVRNLIGAAGADPAVEVEALELGAIEVRVGVEAPRQRGVHDRDARLATQERHDTTCADAEFARDTTARCSCGARSGAGTSPPSAINQVIGGAIFLMPSQVAAQIGAWSPIAFVLMGLASLTVALCFAEVGSRFDSTGGPYLYTRAAFGRFVGFEVGWMQWFTRAASQASVMAGIARRARLLLAGDDRRLAAGRCCSSASPRR